MKVIQVVQSVLSIAFVTTAGFVGGEIAWLLEGVKFDWQIRAAVITIAVGLMAWAISLIIQCFVPPSRPFVGERQQLLLPPAAPSQPYVENEKFK